MLSYQTRKSHCKDNMILMGFLIPVSWHIYIESQPMAQFQSLKPHCIWSEERIMEPDCQFAYLIPQWSLVCRHIWIAVCIGNEAALLHHCWHSGRSETHLTKSISAHNLNLVNIFLLPFMNTNKEIRLFWKCHDSCCYTCKILTWLD